ncbi:DUF4381 domain-containing protein [Formosa sp. PL04]|uniref:DUF4381 domain-containing protein n=1 Tax=Formosa sp. PL04 TaxID=3081755 RepID=UPI002981478F|nr:DUF4381 domain-containing protein [Formosa sp. PL04]MDW5287653.1 DUF4381 domain-containing protein [Formosa sp. PL04]
MTLLKLHTLFMLQDPTQSKTLELGDVIEPTPVAFTFETLGWKTVFFLLALLIAFVGYKIYKNYKKKQYLREAVTEIKKLKQQTELSPVELINAILFVLKDTAMQSFSRQEVAGLYGSEWISFLDSKEATANFKNDETVILDAVYKHEFHENSSFNKDQFTNKSIHWIQHHAR